MVLGEAVYQAVVVLVGSGEQVAGDAEVERSLRLLAIR